MDRQSNGRIAGTCQAISCTQDSDCADGNVQALAAGNGRFYAYDGQTRNFFVATNAATGQALIWDPWPGFLVFAALTTGTTLWLGGYFSSIADTAQSGLAGFQLP